MAFCVTHTTHEHYSLSIHRLSLFKFLITKNVYLNEVICRVGLHKISLDNTYYSGGAFLLILNDLSKRFNYQVQVYPQIAGLYNLQK